jgi:hypothetical protein
LIVVELKNNSSISHLDGTTLSAFCQTGPGLNIPKQNKRIAFKDSDIVLKQITGINSLDEIDLLRFRETRAICQKLDQFNKCRHDPSSLGLMISPVVQTIVNVIHEPIRSRDPLMIERKRLNRAKIATKNRLREIEVLSNGHTKSRRELSPILTVITLTLGNGKQESSTPWIRGSDWLLELKYPNRGPARESSYQPIHDGH